MENQSANVNNFFNLDKIRILKYSRTLAWRSEIKYLKHAIIAYDDEHGYHNPEIDMPHPHFKEALRRRIRFCIHKIKLQDKKNVPVKESKPQSLDNKPPKKNLHKGISDFIKELKEAESITDSTPDSEVYKKVYAKLFKKYHTQWIKETVQRYIRKIRKEPVPAAKEKKS